MQNSDGEILRGNPITIHEALPFLFRPKRTCVWYAFGYDTNMLFANESREIQIELFKNPEHTCDIDGYRLELFPKKILRIIDITGHESSVHYDTVGFFQCPFLKALKDWHIKVPEIIEQGKMLRDEFPKDFDIELYNLTETRLHVELMEKLQSKLEQVGLGNISGYHGAGAIAALMLKNFKALEYAPLKPMHDFRGFEYRSYYGGRIELFKRGTYENVYNYDINSAYPAATRELPTLRDANWIHTKGNEALNYDFGVAKVRWKSNHENEQLGPFPFRTIKIDGRKRRMVLYPIEGKGYYHLVEIKAAMARNFSNITIESGIALEPGYEKPFESPINEIMKQRLEFKTKGDMAHIPLKLGANSFYGKFAQRNKDKHEFGHYANYWYAGYITAWTRAQLLKYMNPDSIILAATDGIYSTEPLFCPVGSNLGEWEYEHYNIGKFILPGIYKVDDTIKSRGYPKVGFDFDNLYTRILNDEKPTIDDKLFVGVRKSLAQHKRYPKVGFYKIRKIMDWNSVSAKRVFMDNSYSEPNTPFLGRTLEQKISAGFLPWMDGKNEKIENDNENA